MVRFPRPPTAVVTVAARLRWGATRRPTLGRIAAVVCIALGAWSGWSALDALGRARDGWGTTVPVAVADVALAPGDRAGPATVSLRRWPAALVPPGAVREVPDAVVTQRVGAGEVLGAGDLGVAAGPAGMLPAGWVAVAVPLDESRRPPLATADRVGVVVAGAATVQGAVVEAGPGLVVVAVPADDAAPIVAAAIDGAVGLTLEPPRP